MPFRLAFFWSNTYRDYTRYLVHASLTVNESVNVPTQCTFSLSPIDSQFILPPERAYVNLFSTLTQKSLFTGFVASRPVRKYVAKVPQPIMQGQLFEYAMTCTSDELLVNIKSVQFIPAFVNRYQGDILAVIADTLCPGFFDTSLLQRGDLVPYFEYDPKKSWSEIAKEFGDAARYRSKGRNKTLVYAPYADAPLGIEYDEDKREATFDPRGLNTDIMPVPTVNDVTIIGQAEAGNNREDYFLGDGFTGNFPLHHKTFQGASVLLLQETWNGTSLNNQNWFLLDPASNFDFSAGALNLIDPSLVHTFGDSYLSMHNGVEVAGSFDLEHGEFTFNEYTDGIIGGLYSDSTFVEQSLVAGFRIITPGAIIPPGIIEDTGVQGVGVGGVHIKAEFMQQIYGDEIVTQPNHNYVLQTLITAPKYSRYDQIYRTMDGEEFGGRSSTVKCSITFAVQDYDIIASRQFFYTPKIIKMAAIDVEVPAFLAYALVNNKRCNFTITNTTIAAMPQGAVFALTGPMGLSRPSGLILPMLPQSSGGIGLDRGFIGTVKPYPGSASGNIFPDPLLLVDVPVQEVLGNSLQLQAAQVTAGNETDTLSFYLETIPAAGTPVRFQSWESQAALSRLQNAQSITDEADIVGDDGLRSAIVTDLNPLPRTSEDCDNAALAFLKDRSMILYTGNYQCTSLFFSGLTEDWQFYPTVGRMLHINSPRRGIDKQSYLVTSLTMTFLDMMSEIISFQIGFGADLYLEKVIKNFVDIQPASVLSPKDKANPPNPRFTQNVTNSFLPDLNNVQADLKGITDDAVNVIVYDDWTGDIEVRLQDTNWGRKDTTDYVDTVTGPKFTLQRRQIDQTWFMRPSASGLTSRRTKVIRVVFPQRPAQPLYIGASAVSEPSGPNNAMVDSFLVQYGFNGDMRNIYGFELRAADNRTILVQKPLTAALSDINIDLAQTPMPYLDAPFNTDFEVYAYFFNAQWSYSEALPIDVRRAATSDLPLIWSPGWTTTKTGDQFFTMGSFGIQPWYKYLEDGTPMVSFYIQGQPPVNEISKHVGEPVILDAKIDYTPDPNYRLNPGTYAVGVNAWDGTTGTFNSSPMSNIVHVTSTQYNSAILLTIDPPDNNFGMDVFISAGNSDSIWFWENHLPSNQTSYALMNVPFGFPGAPDDEFDHFHVQYKTEWHAGILGAQIQPNGVTPTTLKIGGTSADGTDFLFDPDTLIGRTVSLLAKLDNFVSIPIANYRISGNTPDTLIIGPSRHGEMPPDLTTIFEDGDVVSIRMLPQNITSNSWEDPMLMNPFGKTGLNPGEEVGRLAWIIDGPGRGQVRPVSDNTQTKITLTSDWDVLPTSESTIVIVDNQWMPGYDTQSIQTANRLIVGFGYSVAQPDIQNLGGVTWFMRVLTVSADGRYNDTDPMIPYREGYAFPAFGSSQQDMGIISYDSGDSSSIAPPGAKRGFRPSSKYRIINGVYVKSTL